MLSGNKKLMSMIHAAKKKRGPYKTKAKGKIDKSELLKLYFINGLSKAEIARHFDCAPSSVTKALRPFEKILASKEDRGFFEDKKTEILSSLELKMLSEIANPEKLKKASVNNLAYAFRQIFDAERLEAHKSTSNIAYQDITRELMEAEKALEEYEKRQQKALSEQ
jgi:predicted DNA-binding protein YlxM (UPF0122 family)